MVEKNLYLIPFYKTIAYHAPPTHFEIKKCYYILGSQGKTITQLNPNEKIYKMLPAQTKSRIAMLGFCILINNPV